MSRLILVFLALILIVSFVHGQRFVSYECTLVFFRLELTNVLCQTFPKRTCAPYVTGRS